ncbi:putative white-brown complex homolog protein 30 [Nematostella vectensis]|nr:putative white-brown complex homolog protein 30 [Nematostella vectensis]
METVLKVLFFVFGALLCCSQPSVGLTRETCSASTTDIPMSCCPTEMLAFCCLPIVRPCNETLQLQLAELMANFSRLDVSFPQVPSYRKRRDLTGISRGNTSSVDKIPVTTGVGDLPNLGDFSSLTDFLASKNSSSSQRKPYCVHPMNSSACLKGFFLDKTSQAAKPCPPGFYCPQDQLCIIPCPEGSHCQTGRVVASTDSSSYGCRQAGYCCEPSGKVPIYDPVDNQYICPGSHLPSPCKQGYYCANVTERVICPKGSFCREGSTTPEPCPLLASCEEGVSAPVIMTAGIALLVLILVIAIVIVVGFKYRRPIRFYSQLYVARYLAREKEVFQLDSGLRMVAERAADVKTRAEKIVPKNYTVDITFKDLNLKLNSGTKKTVLMGVTGKIKSGEVTAVMGPSGAGKTTFLNTLSGKAYYGTRGGEIFINGKKEDDLDMYRTITGFVPQEDVMHRNLTVKEVLRYQAELRLSSIVKKAMKEERIHQIIELLELERIQDSQIGDETNRGISGGQRKRVNIGMELVVDPTLLFLDEPTSGLDSTSSLSVLNALRAVAERGRLTIVCVIHQPRFEIFRMFHNLLFLGPGGRTVFQGSVDKAEEYFQRLGFEKPLNVNPADFYMDVIGGLYVKDNFSPTQLFDEWETYQTERDAAPSPPSEDASLSNGISDQPGPVAPSSATEGVELVSFKQQAATSDSTLVLVQASLPSEFKQRKMANVFAQLLTFYKRENRLLFRIFKSLLLDQMMVLVAGLLLGALNMEVSLQRFFQLQTISSMALGMTAILPSLRCFGNNRTTFWREAASGVNRFSYFLAVDIAQVPIMLISPLVYLSLLYALAIPRGQFIYHYASTVGAWFACVGSGYLISIVFNTRNAQMASVIYTLVNSLLAGSNPSLCDLDDFTFVGPALYNLSYARWYMESLFEVEANRYPRVLSPLVYGVAAINGYTLQEYGFCLTMMFVIGIGVRIIAFALLCLLDRGKQK